MTTIKEDDLSGMSTTDLDALMEKVLEAKVDRLIDDQTELREEHRLLMERIDQAVSPFGLDAVEFLAMTRPQLKKHLLHFQRSGAPVPQGATGRGKGGKVPPKYRHPEKPELVWTGRGNKPVWVREWLDSGRKIEDALIRDGEEGEQGD